MFINSTFSTKGTVLPNLNGIIKNVTIKIKKKINMGITAQTITCHKKLFWNSGILKH
jgi:hypothetical protein